jgi:hypothetical protein
MTAHLTIEAIRAATAPLSREMRSSLGAFTANPANSRADRLEAFFAFTRLDFGLTEEQARCGLTDDEILMSAETHAFETLPKETMHGGVLSCLR